MNDSVPLPWPGTLFPLRKADAAPSLIVLPDLGNSVMYMKKVLAALPAETALCGMRLDRDLIGRLEGLEIPEIAAKFAADIVNSGYPPPYRLAGHSFAGILAFETAIQLEKLGAQEVEVVLLDAGLPAVNFWELRPRQWAAVLAYHIKYPAQRLLDRWRDYRNHAETPQVLHHRNFLRMDLSARPPAYQFIIRGLYRAMTVYSPGRFSGKLTLLRATKRGRLSRTPVDLGWQRVCRQPIRILDIQCNHLDMVRADLPARTAAALITHLLQDWSVSPIPAEPAASEPNPI